METDSLGWSEVGLQTLNAWLEKVRLRRNPRKDSREVGEGSGSLGVGEGFQGGNRKAHRPEGLACIQPSKKA